jgi:bifunctional DNase/RNase
MVEYNNFAVTRGGIPMLEMTIDSIRVSMMNYQHVVILREKNSDRYLPIWIGPAEAEAISLKLQNLSIARPMTHDLLKNAVSVLESLSGAVISRVVVNDLRADTFYAQIVFEFNDGPIPTTLNSTSDSNIQDYDRDSSVSLIWQGKEHKAKVISKWQESGRKFIEAENSNGLIFELCLDKANNRWLLTKIKLDSRPSDAIALAVRATTPIYVEDSVLDKAGIILDKETGKPVPMQKVGGTGEQGKVDEQELKKLSAFYDFINTLDLDDLGKRKS